MSVRIKNDPKVSIKISKDLRKADVDHKLSGMAMLRNTRVRESNSQVRIDRDSFELSPRRTKVGLVNDGTGSRNSITETESDACDCDQEVWNTEAKQTDGTSYLTVTGFVNCRAVIRQLQRQLLSSSGTVARVVSKAVWNGSWVGYRNSYGPVEKLMRNCRRQLWTKGKGSDTEHRERKKLMETKIAGKDRSGSDPTVLELSDGVFGVHMLSVCSDELKEGSDTVLGMILAMERCGTEVIDLIGSLEAIGTSDIQKEDRLEIGSSLLMRVAREGVTGSGALSMASVLFVLNGWKDRKHVASKEGAYGWIVRQQSTEALRLTEPSRVRPDWSFGWNHDQTTELTVPEFIFPDQLDILRLTVEPNLAWVVKKPKMDMHSHPADHSDYPASILIFTPCIHLVRMNLAII
ncbi:hypothetical protein YC2023_010892 [Brassica napus]